MGTGFLWGCDSVLELNSDDSLHNIMDVLNATKPYILKWLKYSIL
jgi:hypothetical protein